MLIYGHEFPEAAEKAVLARLERGPAKLMQLAVTAENAGCNPQASYRGVDRLMQRLRKDGAAVFDKHLRAWRLPQVAQ